MAENMEEDLGLFEAATHSRNLELKAVPIGSLLVVADGSNQDLTSRAIGQSIARRFSATMHERSDLKSAAAIQDAAAQLSADLIVVPAPFGEDIQLLHSQSLGSVVDALLHESSIPLLCVREPLSELQIQTLMKSILVPVSKDNDTSEQALSWACSFPDAAGTLVLLELADQAAISEAQQLVQGKSEPESVRQAAVGRAMTARLGALVAATQRRASEHGFAVQVEFRMGKPIQEILAWTTSPELALIVIARHSDRTSAAFHLAADLLLASKGPVLLI